MRSSVAIKAGLDQCHNMAITGTSKNYTGRKVDLSLYPELTVNGNKVSAGAPYSRAIAGPSKVAQNFARILFTPLGKYRGNPDLGSNFMQRIQNGAVKYDIDLLHLFAGESLGVMDFMSSNEPESSPDDERILSVEMTKYSAMRGAFSMTVELKTRGGDSVSFLLPVVWSN